MYTDLASRMEELEARLDVPTVSWLPWKYPEQPTKVIGVVSDRRTKTSDFINKDGTTNVYPVLSIRDARENVEWTVYCSPAQLQGKVERLDPQIGDLVGTSYLGKPDENDPQSPHRHNFEVYERAADRRSDADESPARTNESVETSTEATDSSPANSGAVPADDDIPF